MLSQVTAFAVVSGTDEMKSIIAYFFVGYNTTLFSLISPVSNLLLVLFIGWRPVGIWDNFCWRFLWSQFFSEISTLFFSWSSCVLFVYTHHFISVQLREALLKNSIYSRSPSHQLTVFRYSGVGVPSFQPPISFRISIINGNNISSL